MSSLPKVLVVSILLAASATADPVPFIAGFAGVHEQGVSFPVFPVMQNCSGDPCDASASIVQDVNRDDNGSGFANLSANRAFFKGFVSEMGTGGFGAEVSVTLYDNLTISSGSFLELPFHITGAVTAAVLTVPTDAAGTPRSDVEFFINCSANPLGSFTVHDCTQDLNFSSSQSVDTTMDLIVPFGDGQKFGLTLTPTLEATVFTVSNFPDNPILVSTGQAVGDFSHSVVLGPAVVLDANMHPITGATITSDSGFDYFNPPGEPNGAAVPEPSALILCAAALGFVFLRRRRIDPPVR
jgi:hypothetical protein